MLLLFSRLPWVFRGNMGSFWTQIGIMFGVAFVVFVVAAAVGVSM